jgi:hypothetical protein
MMSMVVLLIEFVPVSNLFDDDDVTDDPKQHSEIPRPQAIPAGKVSSQRLGPAHVWPFLQPFQQVVHPRSDRHGEVRKLFSRRCGKSDHRSIMTYYDKNV